MEWRPSPNWVWDATGVTLAAHQGFDPVLGQACYPARITNVQHGLGSNVHRLLDPLHR